ncbi:MAG: hypothetical protein OXF73_13345 [Gammaproteobacteria bacterium]|nr:hypothetical protein [Gammaproteobacteria bacterium]MCY4227799.1 hypothetical protein [Gammaproteobacteria bacterium]
MLKINGGPSVIARTMHSGLAVFVGQIITQSIFFVCLMDGLIKHTRPGNSNFFNARQCPAKPRIQFRIKLFHSNRRLADHKISVPKQDNPSVANSKTIELKNIVWLN